MHHVRGTICNIEDIDQLDNYGGKGGSIYCASSLSTVIGSNGDSGGGGG